MHPLFLESYNIIIIVVSTRYYENVLVHLEIINYLGNLKQFGFHFENLRRDIESLGDLPNPQVAYTLLRECASSPMVNHLMRSVDPEDVNEFFRSFDLMDPVPWFYSPGYLIQVTPNEQRLPNYSSLIRQRSNDSESRIKHDVELNGKRQFELEKVIIPEDLSEPHAR
ncbi:hypothetical protein GJ496_011163 [Pomphorhynchus laevis]|nr:hypothetical protein GJ496_011163 [Pomphorhynchus laevis]